MEVNQEQHAIGIPTLKCNRCNGEFFLRSQDELKNCPECKLPYWNKERIKEGSETELQILKDRNLELSQLLLEQDKKLKQLSVNSKPSNLERPEFSKQQPVFKSSNEITQHQLDLWQRLVDQLSTEIKSLRNEVKVLKKKLKVKPNSVTDSMNSYSKDREIAILTDKVKELSQRIADLVFENGTLRKRLGIGEPKPTKSKKSYKPRRKKGTCPRCQIRPDESPHHIVPRSRGGKDNKENLIRLCKDCHTEVELLTDSLYSQNKLFSVNELRHFITEDFPESAYS